MNSRLNTQLFCESKFVYAMAQNVPTQFVPKCAKGKRKRFNVVGQAPVPDRRIGAEEREFKVQSL